tara:strand:+ start:1069 stop:1314 length:246 start_codon:yes stop_codon:yes gene_type:complete
MYLCEVDGRVGFSFADCLLFTSLVSKSGFGEGLELKGRGEAREVSGIRTLLEWKRRIVGWKWFLLEVYYTESRGVSLQTPG